MSLSRGGERIVRTVVAVARERRITVMAAGLAYYAFNSLIPFFLLVFIGLSAYPDANLVARGIELSTGLPGAQVQRTIEGAVGDGAGRARAAVLAALILVWSSLRMFQAVHEAFAEMYDDGHEGSYLGQIRDVTIMLLTLSLAMVAVAVVGVTLSFVVKGLAWTLLSPFLLIAVLLVVFVPMYYLFPHTDTSIREALPGAVFTAVAWTVSGIGFRLYATTSQSVQLYGVAGAVLLLLTWMYLGGLALLVGVVLNAVLARRVDPDHDLVPESVSFGPDEENLPGGSGPGSR